MKTLRKISILMLFCSIGMISYGQTWINPGAVWHFNYGGLSTVGFVKVTYTGDTLIDGRNCQRLDPYRYMFTYYSHTKEWRLLSSHYMSAEFTSLSGDTVFWYKNDTFHVLYNFGAQPGDTWDMGFDTNWAQCSKSIIHVDSVKFIELNGNTYRCLYLTSSSNASRYFQGWVCEKFGNMNGYLFPMENVCDSTIVEWDDIWFACYEDSSFALLNVSGRDCEYLLKLISIPEREDRRIYVSPNPVQDKLLVYSYDANTVRQVTVFDIHGRQMVVYHSSDIDFKEYKSGLYFVKIDFSNGEVIHQKILKH